MSDPLSQEGALHEAVERAEAEIVASVSNAVLVSGRPLGVILRDLYRAAQVSALESVAKEMCGWCKDGVNLIAASTEHSNGWWHYEPGRISRRCTAPQPVMSALSLLRSSRSDAEKETP